MHGLASVPALTSPHAGLEADINSLLTTSLVVVVFITAMEGKLEHEPCFPISALTVIAFMRRQSCQRNPVTCELKTFLPTICAQRSIADVTVFLSHALWLLVATFISLFSPLFLYNRKMCSSQLYSLENFFSSMSPRPLLFWLLLCSPG